MSRNQNWNRDGWNRNDSYSSPSMYRRSENPAEGERMSYASEQGYGQNINSSGSSQKSSHRDSHNERNSHADMRATSQRNLRDGYRNTFDGDYQNGLNQFERGRKASRDYDRDYTGYRSSLDDGDTGYERERWNAQRVDRDNDRHTTDHENAYRTGPQLSSSMNPSGYSPMYSPSHDGRQQGYRTPEAQYRASSAAGKGPKGWKRTDERIREDVCHVLEADHVVDATEIEVTVKDGVVTLSGHTETRPVKRRAEDLIESISGVKDVRNELAVDQSLFQQAKEFLMGDAEKKTVKTPGITPRH